MGVTIFQQSSNNHSKLVQQTTIVQNLFNNHLTIV